MSPAAETHAPGGPPRGLAPSAGKQPTRGLAGAEVRVLTPRQTEIVTFVLRYRQRHGYSPSLREIADAVGVASPYAVAAQLRNLRAKGAVTYEPGVPRTVVPRPALLVPFEGEIG